MSFEQFTELAWAAGFMEADGSWFLRDGRRPVFQASQTDRDRLLRLQRAMGVGTITGPHAKTRNPLAKKEQWVFRVTGRGARQAMDSIRPYITLSTRERLPY